MVWSAGPDEATLRAVASKAQALETRLVEIRRHLHMYPELSNREFETSKFIAERLRALGLDEVRTGVAKTGVVGVLRGNRPGPVV
ncbi:MAG: amidohydrolase, partial [Acidobacteria bacterium]|nr:amidohydrolase [Acidobacteriota bacterium]